MDLAALDVSAPGRREARQALWFALAVWAAASVIELAPGLVSSRGLQLPVLMADIVCSAIGALLSFLVACLVHASWRMGMPRRAVIAAAGGALVASALAVMDQVVVNRVVALVFPGQLEIDNPSSFARNVLDLGFYLWICSFYVAVVLLLEANRIAQDRSRRWAEADAAAKSAQLSALRFQLNPHFLFNTLNAVSSLVVTRRNEDAELMIERLSDFLRSTLASAGSQEHTLEDEVQLLEAYLDIELVRFGDRLRFEFAIPADLACARLPSLILQPLVENAVKYAVAPSSRPIQITVEARQEGHCLVLSVVDDGPNAEAPASQPGVRMGLENVTNRLLALYGERGALTCRASPAGFQVELRLPLTKLDERDARPQIGHLHSFEPQGS